MARNHRTDMIPPEYKPTATLLAAALCGASIVLTDGKSGAGWFILALIIIW